MFCSSCGTRSSDDDKFCMACGKALSIESPPPPPTSHQEENLIDLFLPELSDDKQRYEAAKIVMGLHGVPWKVAGRFVRQAPYMIRARVTASTSEPIKREFASKGITLLTQPHGSKTYTPKMEAPLVVGILIMGVVGLALVITWLWLGIEDYMWLPGILFLGPAIAGAWAVEQLELKPGRLKIVIRTLGILLGLPVVYSGFNIIGRGWRLCADAFGILLGVPLIILGFGLLAVGLSLLGVKGLRDLVRSFEKK